MGWLALLILEKGQCEGLSFGIGAEELTPTSFLFPNYLLTLNWGAWRHKKTINESKKFVLEFDDCRSNGSHECGICILWW